MHIFSFLPSIAAVVGAVTAAAMVPTQGPPPTPHFEPLFVGQVAIDTVNTLNTTGPFGVRFHGVSSGGNLTNAKTGKKVGTILPFTDVGILSSSGVFFADAVVPVTWDVDGHLASFSVIGLGNLYGVEMQYLHAETDSPTYSWMTSNFFIITRNTTGSAGLIFTIFGLLNSTSPPY